MEIGDNLQIKNVSYLCARDPSIVAFNRPGLTQIRTNLYPEGERDSDPDPKESENIRVYLRIKNGYEFGDLYEISDNTLICNVPEGSSCMRNVREGDTLRKMYTFSRIFKPATTQTEIFNSIVKPKILDFINGENSTLLTYGASGSGKTFTVIGTDEEPGVVPRSLEYLFRTIPKLAKSPKAKPLPQGNVTILNSNDCRKELLVKNNLLNTSSVAIDRTQHIKTYTTMQQRLSQEPIAFLEESSDVSLSMWVSFAEIYNEQIYDLLQADPPRGQTRPKLRLGQSQGNVFIKNLTDICVSSGLEAYQILQYGIHNLNYATTNVNSHSSRSHSIFTIKLVQFSKVDNGVHISNFNFCDLAGSERSKKTMNVGERLKESNNINSSLLVLGRCISAVRNSQKQHDNKLVPFRESKLTQLFQKALSGHEDIAMIVNINPKKEMFDETQHVLNFSAVAKDISLDRRAAQPIFKKKSRFSELVESESAIPDNVRCSGYEEDIEKLRNAVIYLRNELEQQQNEFEINEKLNRDYIIQGYEEILADVEARTEKRIKLAEDRIRGAYEAKLEVMKLKYESMMIDRTEKNDVIVIESSDDEKELEEVETMNDLKQQASMWEKKATRLEIENEVKDLRIKEFKEKNYRLKEEIKCLKQTINDGVEEYKKLAKMCEENEEEILLIRKQNLNLENDLEEMKTYSITQNIDETESASAEEFEIWK